MDDSSRSNESEHDDDHARILLEAIDGFLRGEMAVDEFRRRFYDYYVDVLPEWALTDRERRFFGAVQEKLDWVDEQPDAASRADGWVDHAEFQRWLSDLRGVWQA